jgi:hypothetical protein
MRTAVFLAFHVEAGDRSKDFQPGTGIAPNFDLRRGGLERAERLVEQVSHGTWLRLLPCGAEVPNAEGVIHPHVEFQETRHVPLALQTVVPLQQQDVAPAGRSAVTLALAVPVGMRQCCPDARPKGGIVVGSRRTKAIRELGLFHVCPCKKA